MSKKKAQKKNLSVILNEQFVSCSEENEQKNHFRLADALSLRLGMTSESVDYSRSY